MKRFGGAERSPRSLMCLFYPVFVMDQFGA